MCVLLVASSHSRNERTVQSSQYLDLGHHYTVRVLVTLLATEIRDETRDDILDDNDTHEAIEDLTSTSAPIIISEVL